MLPAFVLVASSLVSLTCTDTLYSAWMLHHLNKMSPTDTTVQVCDATKASFIFFCLAHKNSSTSLA